MPPATIANVASRVTTLLACSNPFPTTTCSPPAVVTVDNTVYLFLVNLENRRDDLLQSLSIEFGDVERGSWRPCDGPDLPHTIQIAFLLAVERQVGDWIVQHSSFEWASNGVDRKGCDPASFSSNQMLQLREPMFEFRALSSNRKDNWSTIRDDEVPRPYLRTKAVLSRSAHLHVHVVVSNKEVEMTSDSAALMRIHGLAQLMTSKVDVWEIADDDIFSCDVVPRLVEKEKSRAKRPREEKIRDVEAPAEAAKDADDADDDDKDDDDDIADTPEKKNPLLGQFDPDEEFMVPIAPDLPSKGRDVCIEFPLESGSFGSLKRARKVQQFIRKVKQTKRKKDKVGDDPLSTLARVKVVDHETNAENIPMPLLTAPTSRPFNLTRQALEWLASDSQAELMASKKSSRTHQHVPVATASAYKTTLTFADEARYLSTNVIPPPYRTKVAAPDFRNVESVTARPPSPVAVEDPSERMAGSRILAKESVVGWVSGRGETTGGLAPPRSEHQVRVLESLVEPHLQSLSQLYGLGASKWLNVRDYLAQWTGGESGQVESQELNVPSFLASKADSFVALSPSLLPEWSLRSCDPISGPKSVTCGIICPQSSNDWIASLVTRYIASLRSSYVNAKLGSLAPCDLSTITPRDPSAIDADHAMVVINKSDDPKDPFKTYGEAASTFDASTVPCTVFVVAPFGANSSHRLPSLYAALSRGARDASTTNVSYQIIFIEDLVETCVHVKPTYFLDQAFALYDTLATPGLSGDASACFSAGLTKKMYHLADSSDDLKVLLGYGVVNGWLVWSLVDSCGGTMATDSVFIDTPEVAPADIEGLVDKALTFLQLVRDSEDPPGTVVATKLGSMSSQEMTDWVDVWTAKRSPASAKTAPFIKQFALSSATVDLDIRWTSLRGQTATACALNNVGLVLPPQPEAHGALGLHPTQHTLQVRVEAVVDPSCGDRAIPASLTMQLVQCFHDLAWLTTHPTTLRQLSALPVHLFAVQKMMPLVASARDTTSSFESPTVVS